MSPWDREIWTLFMSVAPITAVITMWKDGFVQGLAGLGASLALALVWWVARHRAWRRVR